MVCLILGMPFLAIAQVNGGVTFTDIAAGDGAGITYRRSRSPIEMLFDLQKQQPQYSFFDDVPLTPTKGRGSPGVALFDYDRDGDLDIYVTNGPGTDNNLYSNQLRESGRLTFVDVAKAAGVAATGHDGTGVSFGDIDNDGDDDLLVLGRNEPNLLFENQGNGRFIDISETAGVGGGILGHTTASMGDINGDGLLDIAVSNTFDWVNMLPIFAEPYALNHGNQLFLNLGENRFRDISDESGIRNLTGFKPERPGSATISWAIAMVDFDLDGDVDIIHADDNGAIPLFRYGGIDRGLVHVLRNDGTGRFTDVTAAVGTDQAGDWMGLSFGDINSDGFMDFFASNLGDYMVSSTPVPNTRGDYSSQWFLGGTTRFTYPGTGPLRATPFGWGVSMADYDNDGDTDITFGGGLDVGPFVDGSNPGAILQNDGSGRFALDSAAIARSTDDRRRVVQGLATGDLNNDGFIDIVSASSFDTPEEVPLLPYRAAFGASFDSVSGFVPSFIPIGENLFRWSGIEFKDGTLSVEVNSGGNGNGWAAIQTVGSDGLVSNGKVNRNGIGAVVFFRPNGGKQVMRPIVGGASYASQDSIASIFGLGAARKGVVEVLWPGGVRNRLYNVRNGERIVFPEIPVSFTAAGVSRKEYRKAVKSSLDQLVAARVLTSGQRGRFMESALRAFDEARQGR